MNTNLLRLGQFALVRDPQGTAGFFPGGMAFHTNLKAQVLRDGKPLAKKHVFAMPWLERLMTGDDSLIDLGSGLVTHAGVRLLSQDTAISAGAATLNVMKNHGTGTGTTAAAATDTALQTAIGTTATAGTNTNADASPNATWTSTCTVSYTTTNAVTEWGLFNQTTLSGATMWDHKVFTAINVVNGDSIQFTYTNTISSGG